MTPPRFEPRPTAGRADALSWKFEAYWDEIRELPTGTVGQLARASGQ